MVPKICSISECSDQHAGLGYCRRHYKRFRRYGDPLGTRTIIPADVRFWAKVDKRGPGECWNWTAGLTAQGYGGFHPAKHETELAHRWSYRAASGSLEPGLVIDHLCRNRTCVNPEHLEQVENLENLRRGAGYALANGMRSACINGHEYTSDNTYIDPAGGARCRRCASIRDAHRDSNRARRLRRINERQAA
jgi:hypothetical protein